jgi:hypothetical protein
LEEFPSLPNLGNVGNDLHDLNSVSEGSDIDHFRVSSASSFISLPQAQMLSSNNLESITIDDFLKSANESTAVLEQQLQANMGIEPKRLASQDVYVMPEAQVFDKAMSNPGTSLPMTTTATEPLWPTALFDPNSTSLDDSNFFAPPWVQ